MKILPFVVITSVLTGISEAQNTAKERFEAHRRAFNEKFSNPTIQTTWPILLARVVRLHPTTTPDIFEQRGEVELRPIAVFQGEVEKTIRLPYVYAKFSLWNPESPYKSQPRPGMTGHYVWPDLDNLIDPLLLVIVNPLGRDVTISADPEPKAFAVRVQEVTGENDPKVKALSSKLRSGVRKLNDLLAE